MKKKKGGKKMKLKRFRKNIKAISPIISVLLMIAVAVVAALVTYAWVRGFIGFTTNKTGKALQIQSIALSGGNLNVYVQNVGDSALNLNSGQCLYINGTLNAGTASPTPLPQGKTATIISTGLTLAPLDTVTVKVTSADGTYSQITQQLP
jgi:flagellin-like protein